MAPIPILLLLTEIELLQDKTCLEPFAQSNHLLAIQIAFPYERVDRELM
jgi:hypothetical protein